MKIVKTKYLLGGCHVAPTSLPDPNTPPSLLPGIYEEVGRLILVIVFSLLTTGLLVDFVVVHDPILPDLPSWVVSGDRSH
jgi:hypothetical protein